MVLRTCTCFVQCACMVQWAQTLREWLYACAHCTSGFLLTETINFYESLNMHTIPQYVQTHTKYNSIKTTPTCSGPLRVIFPTTSWGRGATYFNTLSNTEIPIHRELYLYLFMICDVLVLQDIEVQARKACCDWCGKALWNRLVRTCQLLPRRTLLPADVALAISSVKSNQSSNKTKQAKPNLSSMCLITVLQVNSPSWLLE